jgi:hypothetical protein
MWATDTFVGFILAAILFMLYFLAQLRREQMIARLHDRSLTPENVAFPAWLQLQNDWAALERVEETVVLHSVWSYGSNRVESKKGGPTCEISSLYW